ncbi:MAG TPA: PhzF family phenazine biosynthesis protein [Terriglobales bacterium]|nr:PhzF family phenazine biosynthesis protein [Terriglobales bacterium]
MPRLPFITVDVFTSTPLQGNQLAVFTDGSGLSAEQMQSIARETNLSETTFVIPRTFEEVKQSGYRVRIFTVYEELPFAGHPTLGTAWVLRGIGGADEIVLDLNIGKIPVRFSTENGQPFGEMRQTDPVFGKVHSREDIARIAGLNIGDISDDVPIHTVSTGVPFVIVPIAKLSTLQTLSFAYSDAVEYLAKSDGKFLYFVSRETLDPQARLHARMIFYNGEDPATGSAAGCTAGWMAKHGVARSDEHVLIEQGIEAKRPSRIFVRAEKKGDSVVNVRVGGQAVEVARGELFF